MFALQCSVLPNYSVVPDNQLQKLDVDQDKKGIKKGRQAFLFGVRYCLNVTLLAFLILITAQITVRQINWV